MSIERLYTRYPKGPIERRAAAFGIDFVGVWLVSSLVGFSFLFQMLAFILLWLTMRVVLVSSNQGQTLGRWALDMKVLDANGKIPGLLTLGKREGILGFCALLAMIGVSSALANPISFVLLTTPLAVDGGAILADAEAPQALHDRVAKTIVIQTRRGFSLDLRLKRLFAQVKRRMK
jgi:uncharacterized RDD family membrane protein YckC